MKALVGAFNQEKALVGAFSVIVKTGCGTDGSICGTIVHTSIPYFSLAFRLSMKVASQGWQRPSSVHRRPGWSRLSAV